MISDFRGDGLFVALLNVIMAGLSVSCCSVACLTVDFKGVKPRVGSDLDDSVHRLSRLPRSTSSSWDPGPFFTEVGDIEPELW